MSRAEAIPIIIDDIIEAFERHCGFEGCYLDRLTGEIIVQSEHVFDEGIPDDKEFQGDQRYLPIPPLSTEQACAVISRFLSDYTDMVDLLRNNPWDRDPFASVRERLKSDPERYEAWRTFRREEITRMAEDWLRKNNIDFYFINREDR